MTKRQFSPLKTALFAVVATAFVGAAFAAETRTLESPEKRVKIELEIGDALSYRLTFDGARVLETSRLGTTFGEKSAADAAPLPFGAAKIVGESTRQIAETWAYPFGNQAQYVDRCAETTLELEEIAAPNRRLNVVFRAYDDGIAFRYVVPNPNGATLRVFSDDSEFAFGENLDVWASFYKTFNTSQEEIFHPRKLADVKPDSFVGTPLIVRSPNFVAALAESDLLDWSGAQFATSETSATTVKVRLTPRDDKDACVKTNAKSAAYPWRVVLLGKKPVDIINNSGIILNCATPCELDDASWVEPGNSSWDWWAPKSSRKVTNERLRDFIDFSAEMGWRYATVDAGWSKRTNYGYGENDATVFADGIDIPKLVEYADSKNVRLFLWFHCDDLKKAGVEKTFKKCADWGVAGLKIDFMDSHSQEMVQWTTETCRIAAKYRLLINYHGMHKPTGMTRTLPNQINREGVRGNEYNRWSKQTATHVATLPFTRCAIGPADYTPGGFLNEHSETFVCLDQIKDENATCRVVGTRARELALCQIFDSPLRTLCDLPENYRGQPGLEFLRALPAVWDETTALDGEIGEFVVVARRSGDDWYVSAITNEKARETTLAFDFLADGAEYEATIYADAPESDADANAISISTKTVKKGDVETLKLARDGGWNVVLKKK